MIRPKGSFGLGFLAGYILCIAFALIWNWAHPIPLDPFDDETDPFSQALKAPPRPPIFGPRSSRMDTPIPLRSSAL